MRCRLGFAPACVLSRPVGCPPDIGQFLQGLSGGPLDLQTRRELLREIVAVDMEFRWRQRVAPKNAQEYADEFSELTSGACADETLILEEYRVRRHLGDRPSHAKFLAAYESADSKLAEELHEIDDELDTEFNRSTKPAGCDETGAVISGWSPPDPEVEVDGYEVLECLGRGGMGVVYKAKQRNLGRLVALKMIGAAHTDDQAATRFEREVRAGARLRHPNVVQVLDFGESRRRRAPSRLLPAATR